MKLELHYQRPGEASIKIGIADSFESDLEITKAVQSFLAIDTELEEFAVHRYSDRVIVLHNPSKS